MGRQFVLYSQSAINLPVRVCNLLWLSSRLAETPMKANLSKGRGAKPPAPRLLRDGAPPRRTQEDSCTGRLRSFLFELSGSLHREFGTLTR